MIGEVAALCAAISWTFSSVLYRRALLVASPFQANVIRFTSIAGVLVTFLAVLGKISLVLYLPPSVTWAACLSGVIGLVLGDTLYMFSLKLIGVARAVPISFAYPLFNILISVLLNGDEVNLWIVLGAVSTVGGIWLLSQNAGIDSNRLCMTSSGKGVVLALSAAIVWSMSMTLLNMAVTSREAIGPEGILAVNAIRFLSAWFVLLTLSLVFDKKLSFLKMPARTWLTIASGGVVGLLFGSFLLSLSLQHIQESRAVPLSSTTPFFSTVAGIFFLHEPATTRVILGSVIVVLGISLLFM